MNKEMISNRQAISLIVLFFIGAASSFVGGIESKMDLWLSIIIAIIAAFPLFLMLARLHSLFPERNFFDIIDICFGKYLGKALIILYSWFLFYEGNLVFVNIGLFIQTTLLTDTPYVVVVIVYTILTVFGTKYGMEVLGRYSEWFVIVSFIFLIILLFFIAKHMKLDNIQPFLYEGIKPALKGGFSTFLFPFANIIGLTMVFTFSKVKNSPYKIYITGLLIGGFLVFIISLSSILVLGEYLSSTFYYSMISAMQTVDIGVFLHRVDIFAIGILLIGKYVQTTTFLLGACNGIVKLFGFSDYRFVVIPFALFMIILATYDFDSIMRYFEWGRKVWPYYAVPFEVIFPVVIWITAEIKARKTNNSKI